MMKETDKQSAVCCNPRLTLTEAEGAAVEQLFGQTSDRAQRRDIALRDERQLELNRALNAATRELFAKATPDFNALADKLADQLKPDLMPVRGGGDAFDDIAGSAKVPHRIGLIDRVTEYESYVELREWFRMRDKIGISPYHVDPPADPPFARELWWGETRSFWTGSGLTVDIDRDPKGCRIWGHIAHDSDSLLSGHVGVSKFFFLTPDRFPVSHVSGVFKIRPELRTGGWLSGWTGLYHPIWHADDKWSKCWYNLRVTASLSTGEVLDSATYNFKFISLENVSGVGQDNASVSMGWGPTLHFAADLADLRARGVSIILEAEVRFDYQLEGESDLWLRFEQGSNAESVASFDNAVFFRMHPGYLAG